MSNFKKITRFKNFRLLPTDITWSDDKQSFFMNYKWCNAHEKIIKIQCSIDDKPLTEFCYYYLLENNQIQIFFPYQQSQFINIKFEIRPIIIQYLNQDQCVNGTYTFQYDGLIKKMFVGMLDATNQCVFCGYKYDGNRLSVVVPKDLQYPIKIFVVDRSTRNNFINQIGQINPINSSSSSSSNSSNFII